MDAWVTFFQTLLWVLLITGVLWKFHAQAVALLGAIKTRIEKGSSVKAGPFELGQDLRPQEPEQQKKRLDDEVKQAQQEEAKSSSTHAQLIAKPSDSDFRSRILIAEELALRALQSEFDVVINRQVKMGSDLGLDGAFVKDNRGFGVEVKYSRKDLSETQLRHVVSQFMNYAKLRNWKQFTMILAVVYDGPDSELHTQQETLDSTLNEFQGFVQWRLYSLSQLSQKYGLALPSNI